MTTLIHKDCPFFCGFSTEGATIKQALYRIRLHLQGDKCTASTSTQRTRALVRMRAEKAILI